MQTDALPRQLVARPFAVYSDRTSLWHVGNGITKLSTPQASDALPTQVTNPNVNTSGYGSSLTFHPERHQFRNELFATSGWRLLTVDVQALSCPGCGEKLSNGPTHTLSVRPQSIVILCRTKKSEGTTALLFNLSMRVLAENAPGKDGGVSKNG